MAGDRKNSHEFVEDDLSQLTHRGQTKVVDKASKVTSVDIAVGSQTYARQVSDKKPIVIIFHCPHCDRDFKYTSAKTAPTTFSNHVRRCYTKKNEKIPPLRDVPMDSVVAWNLANIKADDLYVPIRKGYQKQDLVERLEDHRLANNNSTSADIGLAKMADNLPARADYNGFAKAAEDEREQTKATGRILGRDHDIMSSNRCHNIIANIQHRRKLLSLVRACRIQSQLIMDGRLLLYLSQELVESRQQQQKQGAETVKSPSSPKADTSSSAIVKMKNTPRIPNPTGGNSTGVLFGARDAGWKKVNGASAPVPPEAIVETTAAQKDSEPSSHKVMFSFDPTAGNISSLRFSEDNGAVDSVPPSFSGDSGFENRTIALIAPPTVTNSDSPLPTPAAETVLAIAQRSAVVDGEGASFVAGKATAIVQTQPTLALGGRSQAGIMIARSLISVEGGWENIKTEPPSFSGDSGVNNCSLVPPTIDVANGDGPPSTAAVETTVVAIMPKSAAVDGGGSSTIGKVTALVQQAQPMLALGGRSPVLQRQVAAKEHLSRPNIALATQLTTGNVPSHTNDESAILDNSFLELGPDNIGESNFSQGMTMLPKLRGKKRTLEIGTISKRGRRKRQKQRVTYGVGYKFKKFWPAPYNKWYYGEVIAIINKNTRKCLYDDGYFFNYTLSEIGKFQRT